MELPGLLALYLLWCAGMVDATEAQIQEFLREMEPFLWRLSTDQIEVMPETIEAESMH